ncbi:MAG: aminotransferase class III-fold pyridoxal phosphate-dependent enzyme [Elusimicrobiota bacterium]|jgi:glutamate-1-semialdehyde 2,1-aminomutase
MSERYQQSEAMLERALKTIPLGSQTFSKSKTQYPHGVSPFFMTRAKGSHVWDADGNEYIDFSCSLAAVTLGYTDPDVVAAVRSQLKKGVIFPLPHPLEVEVAEQIVEMVPCAEMVRFGKNGSDATAGAIRVARAYTRRDHVAVCGYHGWQDWYIGSTTRNLGVPKSTQEMTHPFVYNDLASLEKIFHEHPGQMAAVIMEPIGAEAPRDHFLEKVRDLTHQNGALLIFDETITGFRLSNGGAQELLGVTPDMATFGKGLANGYPLSAVAGRREIMRLMEEVFFSFTFGGEALSLAAANATLKKLRTHNVIATLNRRGQKVFDGIRMLINRHDLASTLTIAGQPSWNFLLFKDASGYTSWQLKSYFQQEVYARGILTIGSHSLCYAHTDRDVKKLLQVYDVVFGLLAKACREQNLHALLKCKPLEPLFKIR